MKLIDGTPFCITAPNARHVDMPNQSSVLGRISFIMVFKLAKAYLDKNLCYCNQHYSTHPNHKCIFNNSNRTHGQVKYIAQAGTFYFTFIEYALQYANNAYRHHHKGNAIGKDGTVACEKGDTQSQFNKSIYLAPAAPLFGNNIIHGVAICKAFQV